MLSVGTQLIFSRQDMAVDLPLRMAVWQDAKGRVWLGWHQPALLAGQHGITDHAEVVANGAALDLAAHAATSPD